MRARPKSIECHCHLEVAGRAVRSLKVTARCSEDNRAIGLTAGGEHVAQIEQRVYEGGSWGPSARLLVSQGALGQRQRVGVCARPFITSAATRPSRCVAASTDSAPETAIADLSSPLVQRLPPARKRPSASRTSTSLGCAATPCPARRRSPTRSPRERREPYGGRDRMRFTSRSPRDEANTLSRGRTVSDAGGFPSLLSISPSPSRRSRKRTNT